MSGASPKFAASEALPLPGGAKPIAGRGGVGGVYPSAPLKARTLASDGHSAFTRAARQRRAQVCGEIILKGAGQ